MDNIFKYFPNCTEVQIQNLNALQAIYKEWNAQINVISRKDMDAFLERHVLHSLGIAKVQSFHPNANVLDVGTGGGFPGIPLAILFPETQFLLVDSIGKKIKVVNAVVEALQLQNVRTLHGRAEGIKEKFDFVVSRAVTQMPDFYRLVKGKFKKEHLHDRENGILYLKGGDLRTELAPFGKERCKIYPLSEFFQEPFFDTKAVVWLKGH